VSVAEIRARLDAIRRRGPDPDASGLACARCGCPIVVSEDCEWIQGVDVCHPCADVERAEALEDVERLLIILGENIPRQARAGAFSIAPHALLRAGERGITMAQVLRLAVGSRVATPVVSERVIVLPGGRQLVGRVNPTEGRLVTVFVRELADVVRLGEEGRARSCGPDGSGHVVCPVGPGEAWCVCCGRRFGDGA